jgi:hypothetical protein
MIALSFSKYKLPHYIYIVAPLAAVLSAEYLHLLISKKTIKLLYVAQVLGGFLFLLTVAVLVTLLNNWEFGLVWVLVPVGLVGLWYSNRYFEQKSSLIIATVWLMLCTGFGLFSFFYPRLLQYQSTSEAAFFIREKKQAGEEVLAFHTHGHAFSFYLQMNAPISYNRQAVLHPKANTWIYTNTTGLNELKASGKSFSIEKEQIDYPVQLLTPKFLSPITRDRVIEKRYIIYIKK